MGIVVSTKLDSAAHRFVSPSTVPTLDTHGNHRGPSDEKPRITLVSINLARVISFYVTFSLLVHT